MKKRGYGILIVVVCVVVLAWGLKSGFNLLIIRYAGQKVEATITGLPSECDKYNRIKVLIDGKEYEVTISRSSCKEGKYKIGQQVELIKHENYDEPVWVDSHPEIAIIIVLCVLFFAYFSIRKYYK